MASRYWVGGAATWDATAGAKWAATSGGAGGAAVPGSGDDVFLDGNSGSVTITLGMAASIASLDCSGFTGNLVTGAGNTISAPGNFKFAPSMTGLSGVRVFMNGTSSASIDMAGRQLNILSLEKTSGTITLLSDVDVSGGANGIIGLSPGSGGCTVSLNGFNLSCKAITVAGSSGTVTLNLGASTVTCTAASGSPWSAGSGATINAGTSTIKLTGGAGTFAGGGKTYNNVWLQNASSTGYTFTGSNTFSDFKVDSPGSTPTVKFTAGTTTTLSTLTVSGMSSGNKLVITSVTSASHTISSASGIRTVQYASISYSTATGGATWNATDSTNGGNNSGWNFTAPAVGSLMFGCNF